jgi:hypothetical protein
LHEYPPSIFRNEKISKIVAAFSADYAKKGTLVQKLLRQGNLNSFPQGLFITPTPALPHQRGREIDCPILIIKPFFRSGQNQKKPHSFSGHGV